MKGKRTKANRKTMNIYTASYGFREPFRILVDTDFVLNVIAQKLEIDDRLKQTLCGEINPMITQCCLNHLYALGAEAQPAVELARTFTRWKCNHWQTKATSAECITGVVGDDNGRQYCIATQSQELRTTLRSVPGTPLVYLNPHSVLILEPPSEATIKRRKQIEEGKLHASTTELQDLGSNVVAGPIASTSTLQETKFKSAEQTMKKKKGAKSKEPNPLSVKKKKKVTLKGAKDGQVKEKKPVKEQEGKVELMRAARDTRKRQRKRAKKSGSGASNASGGKAVEV